MPEAFTISSDVSQGFNWLQSYDYETQNRFIFTAKDNGYLLLNLSELDDDLDLYISFPTGEVPNVVKAGEEDRLRYMLSSTNLGKNDETILLKLTEGGSYVIDVKDRNESALTNKKYTLSLKANTLEQLTGALLPDDPELNRQWHLVNQGYNFIPNFNGSKVDLQSPQSDIQAPKGWKIRHDASEVIVAIIDKGMDISHPDLQPNLWTNPGEIAGNGEDDDNNGLKDDIHGWNFMDNNDNIVAGDHGTHVGGIVGAAGNNGIGVSGVAWSTQLMSLDVFSGGDGTGDTEEAAAIRYAVDNGAKIINLSVGGNHKINPNHYNFKDLEVYKALQYAYENDVFLSMSAGNEGGFDKDVEHWANVGNLDNYTHTSSFYARHLGNIANVGATNAYARKSDYSNYNGSINIYAPGGDSNDGGIYSTFVSSVDPAWNYGSDSGTSMAAPVIAGIAALIRAENPSVSAPETLSIIRATANNVPDGHGSELQIANLHQALTLTQRWKGPDTLTQIDQEIAPIFNLSALTTSQSLTGQLTLSGDSAHDSVIGFYRVLDADGSVLDALGNSIKPGDANYQSIALNAGNLVDGLTNLEVNNEASNRVNYSLSGAINGTYLAPYIISGDNTWFAWSEANSDGLNRFKVLGTNRFGFEDQAGNAGNGDFNDLVLSFASQQIL